MYEKITLPGGVRILYERIPGVRSAALGVWVGCGSRHESASTSGYSHFIEHMFFKGTKNRSARELACEMDGMGGGVNAFTTKECTCFYARCLDSHLPRATDLLCDMFFNSLLDQRDVETELGVILEEIGMYEDSPDDLVTERLFASVYRPHPLSRPILGRPAVLRRADSGSLRAFLEANYTPDRTVVALAGSFKDSDLRELERRFSGLSGSSERRPDPASFTPSLTLKRKSTEQNHLCLAFRSIPWGHPDRYALHLLSTALGGGMSSRLFQELREKRGLCYSVYSFTSAHEDVGLFGIYSALGRESEPEALRLILEELRRVCEDGISADELVRSREQAKANVLLGLESTVSRMNRLARGELLLGHIQTPEEIIAEYDSVTREKLLELARSVFDFGNPAFSAVGKVRKREEYEEMLSLG